MRYRKRFNSSRSSRKGRRNKHATRLRSYGGSRGGIRL